MSGVPKRPHDEVGGGSGGAAAAAAGHSSGASKYPHEDSGNAFAGKLNPSSSSAPVPSSVVANEYHSHPPHSHNHSTFELGPGPKIPRPELRDSDKRSPLISMYRMQDSQHSDHPGGGSDAKGDPAKGERDSQKGFESRGDDGISTNSNKEVKFDGDSKMEKEGFGSGNVSHLNWKESKEYHRGKRYSETPGGNVDPWVMSRPNLHGTGEVGKESLAPADDREYLETHEAVGENKVDLKVEDKFKDKDRKRKDAKHRDWGERDKERSDRRNNNLQVGNSSGEGKDLSREEREAERWERERKDVSKDKERPKEREKDHSKREAWNGVEKDGLHSDKEVVDGSVRMSEQESPASEQKKQKEFDGWKNVDREARDRRKERDADAEGDRPEKRSRVYDRESDDGCADVEGGTDREREVFNHGVHRKRMLRPRGSPQMANRRSRAQDVEGSQGKPEVSTVVYKVGECMQELIKLWKEYESSQADKNGESSSNGPTLEIRIPAEHVTATNRQVRGGQLWGTDIYTDDSDLVAVLMHTGYCRPTASPPPPAIQELRATIRVLPPQDCYISTLRNNVRSRAWGAAIGCSYRVERCCIVKKGGGTIDLEPCLTHTSTVEPTLAPVAVERTMTTRAAASNALRQQRFVREVTIQYNLCNEPWIKYSISIVADKGLKKPLYTSARLKKGEVLYLETHSRRYELCFIGEKMVKATTALHGHETETEKSQTHSLHSTNGERNSTDGDNIMIDVFRWSRCKRALPQKVMRSLGIPLPLEHLEVLEENLDWEDVQWSQTGVCIAGKEYALARVHFLSPN